MIREALDLLREEGLIVRPEGAGTFAVATNRSAQGLDRLQKITDELERGSARVTWEVLDLTQVVAPPFLAEKLHMSPGDSAVVRPSGDAAPGDTDWEAYAPAFELPSAGTTMPTTDALG